MTLNDLEQRNSPYFAFLTEFDSFAGRSCHSGWRQTYNVSKILSPSSSLQVLAKTNVPCSAVFLRELSILFPSFVQYFAKLWKRVFSRIRGSVYWCSDWK